MLILGYVCLVILGFYAGGIIGGIAAIISPVLCGIFVGILSILSGG